MPARIALLLVLVASCVAQPATPSAPPSGAVTASTRGTPSARTQEVSADDETLVQCLIRKGVRLYGASWCKYCHDQLALFGDQASKVPYTDCQPKGSFGNIPECEALKIDAFPTWILSDGQRVTGVRSLKWLATSTGCPLR